MPYRGSPRIGSPAWASWTRIWCLRPVVGRTRRARGRFRLPSPRPRSVRWRAGRLPPPGASTRRGCGRRGQRAEAWGWRIAAHFADRGVGFLDDRSRLEQAREVGSGGGVEGHQHQSRRQPVEAVQGRDVVVAGGFRRRWRRQPRTQRPPGVTGRLGVCRPPSGVDPTTRHGSPRAPAASRSTSRR